VKLKLKGSHLSKGEMCYFPTCAQPLAGYKRANLGEEYTKQIYLLVEEVDRRLTLSKEEEDNQLKLIEDLFCLDPAEVALHLQCEITEYQCSAVYQNKCGEGSQWAFCKSLDFEKYKHLTELALRTFSIFGSTYVNKHSLS
jgi:hypothetical protein